jgi:hypothetical protein
VKPKIIPIDFKDVEAIRFSLESGRSVPSRAKIILHRHGIDKKDVSHVSITNFNKEVGQATMTVHFKNVPAEPRQVQCPRCGETFNAGE